MTDSFTIKQIYVNDQEVEEIPARDSGYVYDRSICSNGAELYYNWNPYTNSYEMDVFYNKVAEKSSKAYAGTTECSLYFVTARNDSGGSGGGNGNNNSNNPNTGAFISYVFILAIIIGAGIVIYYTLKKKKFFRV